MLSLNRRLISARDNVVGSSPSVCDTDIDDIRVDRPLPLRTFDGVDVPPGADVPLGTSVDVDGGAGGGGGSR